jgi:hypothetical protein
VRRSRVVAGLSERAKAEARRLELDNSLTALYVAARKPDPDSQVERLHLIAGLRAQMQTVETPLMRQCHRQAIKTIIAESGWGDRFDRVAEVACREVESTAHDSQ